MLSQDLKLGRLQIKQNDGSQSLNLDSFTLLLPSVSVGNVGQLAVDMLIATFNPTKIGIVYHPALLPLIGYDPYNGRTSEVTTAADLHVCESKKLVILQIRSPLILKEKKSFLEDMTNWIKKCKFKDVLMLSSCHAHLRLDSQLIGPQIRYLANSLPHPALDRLKEELFVKELEEREDASGLKKRFVPGAGFTYEFLELCGVPAISLLKFVDEGDNTADATALVGYLNSWTNFKTDADTWKQPLSWKNMFGSSPPPLIY